MSKEIPFFCPKCGGTTAEEILIDVAVSSKINVITEQEGNGNVDIEYGEQTNVEGYVERYQCAGCGLNIVDDNSPHSEEGLDEYALVKAIKAMNVGREAEIQAILDAREMPVMLQPKCYSEPLKKGDEVDHNELVERFADALRQSSGEELARVWNEVCPEEVMYEGDSLFWVEE